MPVSSTNVKGFHLSNSLAGVTTNPIIFPVILENTATFTIGDAVRVDTNGLLKRCAAADVPLGILQGIIDQNGINVFETSRVPSTSIAGATLTPSDTITTASDNSSNGTKQLQGQVIVDPSGSNLYWNQTNNTGLAQSNLFQYYNILTSNPGQIDTATASNSSGIFQLVGLNPIGDGDTAKGLFRLAQDQMGGTAVPTRAA